MECNSFGNSGCPSIPCAGCEKVALPIFEYAFTFAHGSYTNGEISAQTKEEAMAKIEKSCADDEPAYHFKEWIIIREKTENPPLDEVVKSILQGGIKMTPEDIGYTTELDSDYGMALTAVNSPELFGEHIKAWGYWLDQESKNLTADDYHRIAPLIKDCQTEGIEPADRHNEAIALMMPEKIFRISVEAQRNRVPWGWMCLYPA
jgi:hypothetical protein